jgi:hypothetical protein
MTVLGIAEETANQSSKTPACFLHPMQLSSYFALNQKQSFLFGKAKPDWQIILWVN